MRASHHLRRWLAGCLLLAALPVLAEEIPAPEEYRPVRRFILEEIKKGESPSMAVAVIERGRIVWAEGFGLGDIAGQIRATADSPYLLASVSKPITATGMMLLVDQGKIDLDKPANDYLPGNHIRAFRGSANDVTIRRLANHTSGLPTHYSFFYNGVEPPSREVTIDRYAFTWRKPGEAWEYCNLAFGILDYITSCVAGQPWGEYMEEKVYNPLGMTHTSDHVRAGLEGIATRPYEDDLAGRFIEVQPYGFDHDGASAIWSSANDLARFLQFHLNDGELDGVRLMSAKSAREMRKRTSVRDPEARPKTSTGVAWGLSTYMGYKDFSHSGGMPGVSTRIRAFPGENCGYVVLLNCSNHDFNQKVCKQITEVLLPHVSVDPAKPNPPKDTGAGPFVGEWEGTLRHYEGDIPVRLTVADNGTAIIRFGDKKPIGMADLSYKDNEMNGRIGARVDTQPSFHGLVNLQVRLVKDDQGLSGVAAAYMRDYLYLPHWLELHPRK